MITRFIRNACLATVLSLGAMGAAAAPAAAGNLSFGVTIDNGHIKTQYHGRGYDRGHRARGHRGHRARGCSPRRAVHKASRIGLRHARVVRANRRAVAVAGRLHGDRTIVRFGNRPNCPVMRIRGR